MRLHTHTPDAQNLLSCIDRKGQAYIRSIPSHPICEEVTDAYTQDMPCRSEGNNQEEDHAPNYQIRIRFQVDHHLVWILKQQVRRRRRRCCHQTGDQLRKPRHRLQELLAEEQCYVEDVVIEDNNSYICNLMLVQWLYISSILFPIMYCVVFAIVQNVIFYVGGFEKIVRL